ncbi:hypothetical protein MNQ98_10735 [Paenibacillus sp. N3/727]|uniref:hypothetical protein n=1 Tax=Paenibacillus sp. N3/727 TaxID=2925845 RepID=UPI001F53A813|nr:hypothetical protein [Paenibacillus sp. N3/727]UNK20450.1 hypothetical protein MNQ98_10735 [Paenibacillus sp. N3/727]
MKVRTLLMVLICSSALVLQACSDSESSSVEETSKQTAVETTPTEDMVENEPKAENESAADSKPSTETTETDSATKVEDNTSDQEPKIDTAVFVYADKVDITDSRDITEHIDVVVHMKEEVKPGLATQHVFTQTYEFLQQKDIEGANTITIGVMSGDLRVAQITVNLSEFKAGDHFINSVLEASKIDKMTDEVKEYGNTMELW